MTTTQNASYRVLGSTDDITECDQCGKVDLKGTVILGIMDDDGNIDGEIYVGSTCAAKMAGTRTTGAKIRQQAAGADYQRACALRTSREWVSYYEPFLAQGQGTYIREYTRMNKTGLRDDFAQLALGRLAGHREIIATGGLSALRAGRA